jgi:ornithine carbamoyltransferase
MPRHFLDLDQIPPAALRQMLDSAAALKRAPRQPLLPGRTLAMIFEKPSTRTRVSFEVAMHHLGGHAVVLRPEEMQLGRGETIADTARALSRYVDAVMLRTKDHATVLEFAHHATVPVINGLSDKSHPCQIMADLLTVEERLGQLAGLTVAWIGDCNNVFRSWLQAATAFGFRLRLASPPELALACRSWLAPAEAAGTLAITTDPVAAATGADVVVTDTWISMGVENAARQRALLAPFRVTEAVMAQAHPQALFLHCLPAVRGEEVTDAVLDGPHSAVWDEAENRLHTQKAVLCWCLATGEASL